jgi:uncharacterized protein (TIGR03067 family)
MKTRVYGFVTLLLAAVVTVVSAKEPTLHQLKKQEIAKLEGEWTLVSAGKGSFSLSPDVVGRVKRITIGKESVLLADDKELMRATYKVDPTKSPKTIDYTITGGTHQGEKVLGIYEVDGDRLKLSYAAPGKDRPANFEGQSGDQHVFAIWQKQGK